MVQGAERQIKAPRAIGEGKPCKKCGGTLRYVEVPRSCVACKKEQRERNQIKHGARYVKAKRGRIRKPGENGVPYNPQHRRLGVDDARFAEMMSEQNGKCGCCKKVWHKKLYVDHCHQTDRVRGLLCGPCNTAIGQLGDNLEGLRRALAYLLQT